VEKVLGSVTSAGNERLWQRKGKSFPYTSGRERAEVRKET
jgi:hypothetical protein